MSAIELVEKSQLTTRPDMKSGDTVRVHVKVREGDKERIQIFEGMVIGIHRGGARGWRHSPQRPPVRTDPRRGGQARQDHDSARPPAAADRWRKLRNFRFHPTLAKGNDPPFAE